MYVTFARQKDRCCIVLFANGAGKYFRDYDVSYTSEISEAQYLPFLCNAGILSGASVTSSFFAFSCGFSGQLKVFLALILVISLPFTVWILFCLYGAIQWIRKKKTFQQFRVHCFVFTLAILHVSYTG